MTIHSFGRPTAIEPLMEKKPLRRIQARIAGRSLFCKPVLVFLWLSATEEAVPLSVGSELEDAVAPVPVRAMLHEHGLSEDFRGDHPSPPSEFSTLVMSVRICFERAARNPALP